MARFFKQLRNGKTFADKSFAELPLVSGIRQAPRRSYIASPARAYTAPLAN